MHWVISSHTLSSRVCLRAKTQTSKSWSSKCSIISKWHWFIKKASSRKKYEMLVHPSLSRQKWRSSDTHTHTHTHIYIYIYIYIYILLDFFICFLFATWLLGCECRTRNPKYEKIQFLESKEAHGTRYVCCPLLPNSTTTETELGENKSMPDSTSKGQVVLLCVAFFILRISINDIAVHRWPRFRHLFG